MTPKQAHKAGYFARRDSRGWHLARCETMNGQLSSFVLGREYRTRAEALDDLERCMTHPDGTLKAEEGSYAEVWAKSPSNPYRMAWMRK